MCASVGPLNGDGETSKKDCDAEEEEEDFDIDELECVDEAAEEERRERRHHERRERHSRERRKHSDIPEKYRLDRYHPYRGAFRGRRLRDTYRPNKHSDDERRPNKHSDDERHKSSRNRSSRERSPRRHARDSSHDRTHRHKGDTDEKDIPFEELEEVDCCDELGDDEFTDGASGTGESQSGEDDDHDDTSVLPRIHGTSNGDDDFPDLCEEIDVDAMRRAAAATSTVLFADEHESPEIISSPPKPEVTKTNGVSTNRGDGGRNGVSSGNYRSIVNEARRHHRYVDRNEHRSTRYSRAHQNGSRSRDDRHREKRASSREARPSTSGHSDRLEKVEKTTKEDAGIISVRGPLAGGWCQVEEEDVSASTSEPRTSSKAVSSDGSTKKKSSPSVDADSAKPIGVKDKIPSLLDMCLNGLEAQQTSTTVSLIDCIRDNSQLADEGLQRERCVVNGNESDRSRTKSRSLLDMDIPPPDRNVMRRYAIALNSCELRKRPDIVRSGSHKQDLPSRSPLMSSPRRNDHHDRRQPRAYVHGVRK
ncbi:hypothetical protein TELCIR_03055 [Teladorsagia circumcincta]|uniref:Uncharacterized protein n=1 Tax=Teladorsagia circumcincta TaxID=45464 RepID=A0A2G9UXC9_TELCI|nr:hypothetical protein TELCIR_03055 [Teladorsagia circumcincta]